MSVTATPRPTPALLLSAYLGTFIALLDVTIVNVALPAIGTDLHADFGQLQWIADSFALVLAALILSGGLIGDRYGRKRSYLSGVGVFLIGSLVCALAPTIPVLILGRIIQGAAAALIIPGALSIIGRSTTNHVYRAKLLGLYGMVASVAVVAGPLLGGLLVDTMGWPYIFLINLPIGIVVIILGLRAIIESADPEHAHLDLPGQILGILTLGSLVYATIESREYGWNNFHTLIPLGVFVICLSTFIFVERRTSHPMLPVALFRNLQFAVTNAASVALGFAANGAFFLLSLFLQIGQGHSAILTGVLFLPMTLAIIPASLLAGRLTGRHGAQLPMGIGYALVGTSLIGMSLLQPETPYWITAILFLVNGVGQGLGITPATAAVLHLVPPQRAGIASATVSAARQVGTALGIAILGAIGHAQITNGTSAQELTNGLHAAMLVGGIVALLAAIVLGRFVRASSRTAKNSHSETPEAPAE